MEGLQKGSYGSMIGGSVGDDMPTGSSTWRIVLVGRTGCGKSATGNSILSQQAFESRLSAQPVTRRCQGETGSWDRRSVLVVDTPPIFEAQARTQDIARDVADCYLLSAPGPHVLLLVTQLGRFTEQDTRAAKKVKEVFGPEAMRHAIVLFTHKEDLDGESLEEYVAHTDNQNLRALVRECGGRCCGFNNRATGEEQKAQLEELMAKVERLGREHQGAFLRNNLYSQAELLQLRGGDRASREEWGPFLARVRVQLEEQQRELRKRESSGALRGVCRAKRWITSHPALSALLGVCVLISLALLISFSVKGH